MDSDRVRSEAGAVGLELAVEACAGLGDFVALLVRHGSRTNLVGTLEPGRVLDEIVLDSVQLVPLIVERIGETGVLVDVGAGAGIPCIPLLLALPGWRAVALEPREKRRHFIETARRELGLRDRLDVVAGRLEDDGSLRAETTIAADVDLLVSKAVMPPETWWSIAGAAGDRLNASVGAYLNAGATAPEHASLREYMTRGGQHRVVALLPPTARR